MKKKRFSVEQMVGVLKQAEVGVPVAELTNNLLLEILPLAPEQADEAAHARREVRRD